MFRKDPLLKICTEQQDNELFMKARALISSGLDKIKALADLVEESDPAFTKKAFNYETRRLQRQDIRRRLLEDLNNPEVPTEEALSTLNIRWNGVPCVLNDADIIPVEYEFCVLANDTQFDLDIIAESHDTLSKDLSPENERTVRFKGHMRYLYSKYDIKSMPDTDMGGIGLSVLVSQCMVLKPPGMLIYVGSTDLPKARMMSDTLHELGVHSYVYPIIRENPAMPRPDAVRRILAAHDLYGSGATSICSEALPKNELREEKLNDDNMEARYAAPRLPIRHLPVYPDMNKERSLLFHRLLIQIYRDTVRPDEMQFHHITESTSSTAVGQAGSAVFKIYPSKKKAMKEISIVKAVQAIPALTRRIAGVADIFEADLDERLREQDFPQGLIKDIQRARKDGCLRYSGSYILFLQSGILPIHTPNTMPWDNQSEYVFRKLADEHDIPTESLVTNPFMQRLYTLATLHSAKITPLVSRLVKTEYSDLPPRKYNAELIKIIANHFKSNIIYTDEIDACYRHACWRQEEVFRQRKKSLCLTHGDAKYDNWLCGSVLTDFGSAKISTEYKDIAKSLLDNRYTYDRGEINNYIRAYVRIRELLGNPIFEDPHFFVSNVHDALMTESMRTFFYKQFEDENAGVCARMLVVAAQYSDAMTEESIRRSTLGLPQIQKVR